MTPRLIALSLLALSCSAPALAQIATSNEKGATGAYSEDIESSFTSETRFGPKTAIDDLRAGVDKKRESRERLRQRQQRASGAVAPEEDEEEVTVETNVPPTSGNVDETPDE